MIQHPAKMIIMAGLILVLVGLAWWLLPKTFYLGRLPGDIYIEKPGFKFYFPFTTGFILSALISLIIYLFRLIKS